MKRLLLIFIIFSILFTSCLFKDKYKVFDLKPKPIYAEKIIQDVALIRFFQEGKNDSLYTKFIVDNVFERTDSLSLHINVFNSNIFKTENNLISKSYKITLTKNSDTFLLSPILKETLNSEKIETIITSLSNEETAVNFGGIYDAYYTFYKDSTQISKDFAYTQIDYLGNFKIRFKYNVDSLYAEGRIRKDSTLETAVLKNIQTEELYTIINGATDKQFKNDSVHFMFRDYITQDSINQISIKLIKK